MFNSIGLDENPLNCDNLESFKWLLKQKSDLESRVFSAKCANGTKFWNLNYGFWCHIDGNDLKCDVNYYNFNIRAEFEYLSQTLSEDKKKFEKLIINKILIEEIPENVFQDISFNNVEIFNVPYLERIHTNAFNNITAFNLREKFYISSPHQLRNYPPEYDFWKAFSSLVFIKDIEISFDRGSQEIPDNAFEPINGMLNDLQFIKLYKEHFDASDYHIIRIGNNAFSKIPNLSVLVFENIWISNISAKAFDFETSSTQPLNITFDRCLLRETDFKKGVFSDAKRPLNLHFSTSSMIIHYFRLHS